jgi:hypothetical protein
MVPVICHPGIWNLHSTSKNLRTGYSKTILKCSYVAKPDLRDEQYAAFNCTYQSLTNCIY